MRVRSFTRILFAVSAAALALPARANDLYWNRTDANWYNWSDPANWTDTSGNAVYAAPDAVDTIADHARAEKMNVDLGNGTVTIVDWTWTDNAHNDAVAIRNGALVVTGKSTFRQATVDLYDASFSTVDGEFAYNWGGRGTINVHDGSTFTVSGKFWPRIMNVNVDAGGTFVYASTAVAQNCNYNNDFVVANSGLCDWPDGFRHFSNAWSFRPYFKQLAGEWRLGGDVTYQNNLFWRIELTGGTVSATGDVSFDIHADNASAFAKFTDGADVELAVASGKTLDLSNFAYENAAAVAKTGAGALKLPDLPSTLRWREGAIDFTAWTRTAFDELETGAGVTFPVQLANTTIATLADNKGTLAISKPGLTVSSVAAGATLTGSVTVDLADFSAGSVIVSTPDATLRAKVKAAAEAAAIATGDVIEENGNAVKIGVGGAAYAFTSTTITDLSDPAGWSGGSLPPAGADVVVVGAGVVGTLNAGAPVWNSIAATGGTTLRLAVTPDLATAISVAADSSLAVGAGATVSSLYGATAPAFEPGSALAVAAGETLDLPVGASFSATSAADLPTVSVPATATLRIPGGYGFKNVNLVLEGALEATSDGPITFGTAGANETAWFAMTADGATVTAKNESAIDNGSQIRFVCPEAGGTVVVPSPVLLSGCTFAYTGHDGFAFGQNNPGTEAFAIVADGTDFRNGWDTTVGGACTLRLTNGSVMVRQRHQEGSGSPNYNVFFVDKGVVELEDGGEIRAGVSEVNYHYGQSNRTSGSLRTQPSQTGWECIRILDGGIGCWYKLMGFDTGAVCVSNGVFEVFKGYWWGYNNRALPFYGLTGVRIADGATMTLRGVNDKLSTTYQNLTFVYLDAPFAGGGDLVVTNTATANDRILQPVVYRSDNVCTGSLSALGPKVAVHFADGGNWAGVVNWNSNRMDMTHSYSHSFASGAGHASVSEGPTSFSFGGVRMDTDFALRIWEDGTADSVSIGAFGWSGTGKVALERQGGFEVRAGDRWAIGTQPASLPPPKSADPAFVIRAEDIDGDDTRVRLVAVVPKGIVILLQ